MTRFVTCGTLVAGSDGEPSSDPWRSVGLRVQSRLRAGAGMVSDEIDALMRDVEALSGDDAVFSMLRHPSVSGGDEWWNW